jgi:hypothetical protein
MKADPIARIMNRLNAMFRVHEINKFESFAENQDTYFHYMTSEEFIEAIGEPCKSCLVRSTCLRDSKIHQLGVNGVSLKKINSLHLTPCERLMKRTEEIRRKYKYE